MKCVSVCVLVNESNFQAKRERSLSSGLTVGVGCCGGDLSLLDDTLHSSNGRKWQDDCQRVNETLQKTDHDLELAQGSVVAVEARQKEDLFSRNDIPWIGKATNLDIVGSVWKLVPLCGVKGKTIWVLFRHATGQRFARFGGNDLVSNRFSFSTELVVHDPLGSFVAIAINVCVFVSQDCFINTFHRSFVGLCLECSGRFINGSRCGLIGLNLYKGIYRRATQQSDRKKED